MKIFTKDIGKCRLIKIDLTSGEGTAKFFTIQPNVPTARPAGHSRGTVIFGKLSDVAGEVGGVWRELGGQLPHSSFDLDQCGFVVLFFERSCHQ